MRVLCALPNASEEISGVRFTPTDDGLMRSEEISEEVAAVFLSIPGYLPDPLSGAPADPDPGAARPRKR
jgi:hypothetical protein